MGGTVITKPPRGNRAGAGPDISLEHYLRLIAHRKWLVISVFAVVAIGTATVAQLLPDRYTSETLILVDPQKVPETYVKPTVTGDIRNRLGTLSQQILSATRLQKIIDSLNLYPKERKTMAREDVLGKMRKDISVKVVSDFGGSQDLQAFRISYTGTEPRLVAQVTNELASLFIDENIKAREQQAKGTTDFLDNQMRETRQTLQEQEAKLRDYKLKHIGEMPEQQSADLQILGQLQSQLQLEGDALNRAEQQKSYIQSMVAHSAPVVDLDQSQPRGPAATKGPAPNPSLAAAKARLTELLARYSELYPDVQRLRRQIEHEEAQAAKEAAAETPNSASAAPVDVPAKAVQARPGHYVNPVLESQIQAIDAEIAKHKQEKERLSKLVATYQAKLEAIPVREQEITQLVRDYEISKAHYKQLLENQLSAQTATQLEIRQKGERFSVLDIAQPAERPSSPNRILINTAGVFAGILLGLMFAVATEFLGVCITAPEHIAATGVPVLEVIPVIYTHTDRLARRRRIFYAMASGFVVALVGAAIVLYPHLRSV